MTEQIRKNAINIILDEIVVFHADRNKCPREVLVDNLMIDFELNDTNTLVAIADVINELRAIANRLSETGGVH